MVSAILGILTALAPFIPMILQVGLILLRVFGASKEQLEEFQKLVEAESNSGRLSVETRDKLLSQKNAIQARIEAKKAKEKIE